MRQILIRELSSGRSRRGGLASLKCNKPAPALARPRRQRSGRSAVKFEYIEADQENTRSAVFVADEANGRPKENMWRKRKDIRVDGWSGARHRLAARTPRITFRPSAVCSAVAHTCASPQNAGGLRALRRQGNRLWKPCRPALLGVVGYDFTVKGLLLQLHEQAARWAQR
jgi:hypothetical protein